MGTWNKQFNPMIQRWVKRQLVLRTCMPNQSDYKKTTNSTHWNPGLFQLSCCIYATCSCPLLIKFISFEDIYNYLPTLSLFFFFFFLVYISAGHQKWKGKGLEPEFCISLLLTGQIFRKVSLTLWPLHSFSASISGCIWSFGGRN